MVTKPKSEADNTQDERKAPEHRTLDAYQRSIYLRGKGINPSKQFQLDLIFPETIGQRSDLRHMPNDYARSSLFTARNKRHARKLLSQQQLFHYNEYVTVLYSGPELRAEDDELVFLQILSYAQKCPFGEPFEFKIIDLVRDVGWAKNGRYYDKARECISRLKANEVLVSNKKAYGTSGSISLIQNYTAVNDSEGKPTIYRMWIDRNLMLLFAGNTFTSHSWIGYRALSPVARRLTDYIESHKNPYSLSVEKFQKICGSDDASLTSWTQTVRKACAEVVAAGIAKSITVRDGLIHFYVSE